MWLFIELFSLLLATQEKKGISLADPSFIGFTTIYLNTQARNMAMPCIVLYLVVSQCNMCANSY